MLVTIRKYIFSCLHDQGFEDCSNIQHFFIQIGTEESESNCHPKEIDVFLIKMRVGDLVVYTNQ